MEGPRPEKYSARPGAETLKALIWPRHGDEKSDPGLARDLKEPGPDNQGLTIGRAAGYFKGGLDRCGPKAGAGRKVELVAVQQKILSRILKTAAVFGAVWMLWTASAMGQTTDNKTKAEKARSASKPAIVTVTPRGAYARAVAEARLGRHEQALELLAQLPGFVPQGLMDDLAWRRAESLFALGRVEQAKGQLKLCLKADPRGPWAKACRKRLKELGETVAGEGS